MYFSLENLSWSNFSCCAALVVPHRSGKGDARHVESPFAFVVDENLVFGVVQILLANSSRRIRFSCRILVGIKLFFCDAVLNYSYFRKRAQIIDISFCEVRHACTNVRSSRWYHIVSPMLDSICWLSCTVLRQQVPCSNFTSNLVVVFIVTDFGIFVISLFNHHLLVEIFVRGAP